MKKKDLEATAGVSHYVMNIIRRGEDISTEAVRRIRKTLDCRPDEIMDFNYYDVKLVYSLESVH